MARYALVEGEEFGVPMLSYFVCDKFTVTTCDSFDHVHGSSPSGTYNNHYNLIKIYHCLYHLEPYNINHDTVMTFFYPHNCSSKLNKLTEELQPQERKALSCQKICLVGNILMPDGSIVSISWAGGLLFSLCWQWPKDDVSITMC